MSLDAFRVERMYWGNGSPLDPSEENPYLAQWSHSMVICDILWWLTMLARLPRFVYLGLVLGGYHLFSRDMLAYLPQPHAPSWHTSAHFHSCIHNMCSDSFVCIQDQIVGIDWISQGQPAGHSPIFENKHGDWKKVLHEKFNWGAFAVCLASWLAPFWRGYAQEHLRWKIRQFVDGELSPWKQDC